MTRCTTFLTALVLAGSILAAPAHARLFNCNVVYDEFDSFMNKDFLVQPQAYGKALQGSITREQTRQQSSALMLHPNRQGSGVAIVQTNKQTYGKFLFSWSGRGDLRGTPLLILRNVELFGEVSNGTAVKRYREIRVSAGQTIDLDTGRGTQGEGADIRYQAVDTSAVTLEAVNGAKLTFPLETLCKPQ